MDKTRKSVDQRNRCCAMRGKRSHSSTIGIWPTARSHGSLPKTISISMNCVVVIFEGRGATIKTDKPDACVRR